MRKITLNPRIGNQFTIDFERDWIVVKYDDNNIQEFSGQKKVFNSYRYTAEQLKAIVEVNSVLEQNGQPVMTDEETEHLLYPFGKEIKVDTEDLQTLAGFRVEKTIISL
jgi:hypothetical protein